MAYVKAPEDFSSGAFVVVLYNRTRMDKTPDDTEQDQKSDDSEEQQPLRYDTVLAERRKLLDTEESQVKAFDRSVLTLASGAFGLSILFRRTGRVVSVASGGCLGRLRHHHCPNVVKHDRQPVRL